MKEDTIKRAFPSADEDAKSAKTIRETAQTSSPSYKLAYTDDAFLLRDELRAVRLQLELLKADLMLNDQGIESTIVVLGSARIPDPETALARFKDAEAEVKKHPSDLVIRQKMKIEERRLNKSKYYEEARSFARMVASFSQGSEGHRYFIITGGGSGIMEAANRGADEEGAKNIGLNIVLPSEQAPNRYITPELSFQFHYFAIRKMHFLIRAKAIVIFPGGFGTLDELFDALTLIQNRKIKPIPVILFGKEYWKHIINFEAMVGEGVISDKDLDIFKYVERAEEAWKIIRDFYSHRG